MIEIIQQSDLEQGTKNETWIQPKKNVPNFDASKTFALVNQIQTLVFPQHAYTLKYI